MDVSEMMMWRGLSICHETIRMWMQTCGVDISLKMRKNRWNKVGKKWHMDITYLFLENRWCYLYRAIDKSGNLIDVYLSDQRDIESAKRFFQQCQQTTDVMPCQITTDKEPALATAIKRVFGGKTTHRTSKYLNNVMEQHHRGNKILITANERI